MHSCTGEHNHDNTAYERKDGDDVAFFGMRFLLFE